MNILPSDEELGYEDVNICDASDELVLKTFKCKINFNLITGKIFKNEGLYGVTELNYESGRNLILFFTGKEKPVYHIVSKKFFYEKLI